MSRPRNRVLVVDDEVEVANFVATVLRKNRFEAWVLDDPRLARRKAEELRPDLILLDFYMPKMLGSDLAVLLGGSPGLSGIPIVFMSAMTDADHRTIAAASGGAEFLDKPLDEAALMACVRKLLGP